MKRKTTHLIGKLFLLLLVVTFSCSEDFETTENSNGTHFGIKEKGTKVRIITNDEVNFIKSKLEQ